jgi:hypothetical protein
MNIDAEAWAVIMVALLAANLPFVSQRILFLGPKRVPKAFGWRLLELALMAALALGVGWVIEGRVGQRAPQNWEFYVAAGCLFLTFAFPGFVWRYLHKGGR